MDIIPEEGELVIIRIKKILPYGAFCSLEEYPGKEGFVHISEVASRWIKNIHEFLSEGKTDVAKVINIDKQKGQIDLSLKQITETEKKIKLNFVRKDKRANKLIDQIGKQTNLKEKEIEGIKDILRNNFEDLYGALEEISTDGKEALKDIKLPKKFEDMLITVSKNAIKQSKAVIKGVLNVTVYEPEGVEIIKKTLGKLKAPKDTKIEVLYMGAPKYEIKIEAEDYKIAESTLEKLIKKIEEKNSEKVIDISFEKKK